MKETNTPKKPAVKKNTASSRSTTPRRTASGTSRPKSGTTAKPRARRTPPPPEKKGLSGATILLLLITLLLAAILLCFAIPHLMGADKTTDQQPSASPSDGTLSSLPASPSSKPPSSDAAPLSSPSADPLPSPSPSPDLPTVPSPSEDPTVDPSREPEPLPEPYLQAVRQEEYRSETVKEELGNACTLKYYLPAVVVPESTAVEQAVNEGIKNGVEGLVNSIKNNYRKNYSGFLGPIDAEITVRFSQSETTLSLVLYYTVIAGGGEFVEECKSLNFDRQNGESLTVFHRITDKEGIVNYVTANIDGGESPDLDILHRQPGQGGNALCHGWYIDGQTLTLLYNGKTVDVLNPALLRVSVTGGQFFNP